MPNCSVAPSRAQPPPKSPSPTPDCTPALTAALATPAQLKVIHPQARTTPKIRQEIKDSGLSDREAAKVFNITRATAAKWLKRDDVQDRSHRAHTLHTTLSTGQEAIVLSLRQTLYLPLDDLLYITQQYINADVSRSGLARLLKREGMARLEDVIPKAEGDVIQAKKTFKDYEPGFVHIDIKYLPHMPDETSRRYLFVAIDRATRWVFLHIYHDMSDTSSIDFLRRLKDASPIKISKILTDNGSQFTDRFTSKEKKPSGLHVFDKVCAGMGIEHRLAPPRHPQTNGMVERFNGRINELLQQTRFDSQADLEKTLHNYLKLYNHHIPQRAIGSKTPIQALKEWQRQKPDLFVKRVYEQTGLDTYSRPARPWENGYIERLFGTFKMHLRGHMIRDELHLARSLPSFQFWYNVVRSHQHLGGRTPHQVWCGVDPFKAGPRSVRAFCAWDGRLKAVVLRH